MTQAARIALWLAFQGADQGLAVGGTLWDREDVDLPARHGRAALMALVQCLNAPCPPLAATPTLPDPGCATEPERDRLGLLGLAAGLPRGSRLWLMSDFDWLRDAHAAALGRLAARVTLRLVRLADPVERALPAMGRVSLVDIASGRRVEIDSSRAAQREAFAKKLAQRRQDQDGVMARAGLKAVDIDSEGDDFDTVLARHG